MIYDKAIDFDGLSWDKLAEWWGEKTNDKSLFNETEIKRNLFKRLLRSLNYVEKILFEKYYIIYYPILKERLPALIPQVYLHYDTYTIRQLSGERRIERQRMDFLMLISSNERIVTELDGKQHYANGDKASPKLYADMMKMDRQLKLWGYDVYRFGGYEF